MIRRLLMGSILIAGIYTILNKQLNEIEISKYTIKSNKIPNDFDNYKILQISDLHNKNFGKNNEKLIKRIDSINPDVIFITGDLVDGERKDFNVALELVKNLCKRYKVYHIIGNHEQKSLLKKYKDLYKYYFKELYNTPIINLNNELIKIKKGNSHINLYGIVVPLDYYRYFFTKSNNKIKELDDDFMVNSLGEINNNEYNILLAHSPFFFEKYANWGADLVLSGHVHGGIIRLPYLGGILSPNRQFFPEYDLGRYDINKSTMILSKGLGGSKVLIRVNCKPEIVQINLKCI